MSACRFDRDKGDYLVDGNLCRHDSYGDPTKHCTARRTCSQHVGASELTCARCVSRVRQDVRAIRDLAALMPYAALGEGVNSEAANMAGPAADYQVFSARRNLDRGWLMDNIPERHLERAMSALLADDDEWHPYSVLTRWEFMLREDYHQPRETPTSITTAAEYLDRNLHRIAQDDGQDFPLLAREIRTCRSHLEAVLHNSKAAEKGAPCPECETFVRLVHEYGHWVNEGEEKGWRLHYRTTPDPDDEADHADRWVCPRDRTHWWSEMDYRSWVEERTASA